MDDGGTGDGGLDGAAGLCGDGILDPGEECDDANNIDDDECHVDCTWACGDGVIQPHETCDTAIPAGQQGACPTDCEDNDPCTTDTLSGSECQTECLRGDITAFIDDDGCCPPGGNANNDNDCQAVCDNGVLEAGETCDPTPTCPTTCDDTNDCTTDSMAGSPATCDVVCTNSPITTCQNNDNCCPAGCNNGNDNDCSASCGNSIIETGETCDPPATCPTDCDDSNDCTTDTMTGSPANCNVVCTNTPITAPIHNDGCCPSGANANNDNDCPSICGNSIIEPGEQCDDGGTVPGDGCDQNCQIETGPTVFRISEMYLRDPHTYLDIFLFGCRDVTNGAPLGRDGTNDTLNNNITLDEDNDGLLDLSLIIIFRPLDQAAAGGNCDVGSAECTAPIGSTQCDVDPLNPVTPTTYTNQSAGTCLSPYPGTTYGYSPSITNPTAPCFATGQVNMTLNLAGVPVTLQDTDVGATYVGNPAATLANGLVRGFVSEADAANIDIDLGSLGWVTLAELLPGGQGCCAGHDDRDTHNSVSGWWFYLNFAAVEVTWLGP